jgi:ComF family protein
MRFNPVIPGRADRLWNGLLDMVFPPRCVVCGEIMEQGEGQIHAACRKKLFPAKEPVCLHCGRPVASRRTEYCYDCARKKEFVFRQGRALYLYKGDIKKSMYRFKYSNKREYGRFFADEAAAMWGSWLERIRPDAIVPVPMYRKKEKRRGYNQAMVFARQLSRKTGIPVAEPVLRNRDTRPQKELNDIERENNLKNAFQKEKVIVQYNKILLVDDIYTTGSTADAVSEVLLAAGAKEIYFLCICIGKGA